MGGICRAAQSDLLAAGGTAGHIHLLVRISKNVALADLMMEVKMDSSKWIKTASPHAAGFRWQDGYAGLSVGQSHVESLKRHFARQKQHHRKKTFKQGL